MWGIYLLNADGATLRMGGSHGHGSHGHGHGTHGHSGHGVHEENFEEEGSGSSSDDGGDDDLEVMNDLQSRYSRKTAAVGLVLGTIIFLN